MEIIYIFFGIMEISHFPLQVKWHLFNQRERWTGIFRIVFHIFYCDRSEPV